MIYPNPVKVISEIEVTTHCDRRCVYCPNSKQEQLRGQRAMHMDPSVFWRALDWAKELPNHEGGLALSGIGEPLLHPNFVEMLAMARDRLGGDSRILFSTNGTHMTEKMAQAIQPYHPAMYISMHDQAVAARALAIACKYDLLADMNYAPAVGSCDWAGQVPWFVLAKRVPCHYLEAGWAVVLVDGRISTCCLDASAKGVIGHVRDPIESLTVPGTGVKPYELCSHCHLDVP